MALRSFMCLCTFFVPIGARRHLIIVHRGLELQIFWEVTWWIQQNSARLESV